jgi:hypothetical protein
MSIVLLLQTPNLANLFPSHSFSLNSTRFCPWRLLLRMSFSSLVISIFIWIIRMTVKSSNFFLLWPPQTSLSMSYFLLIVTFTSLILSSLPLLLLFIPSLTTLSYLHQTTIPFSQLSLSLHCPLNL